MGSAGHPGSGSALASARGQVLGGDPEEEHFPRLPGPGGCDLIWQKLPSSLDRAQRHQNFVRRKAPWADAGTPRQ